MYAFNMLSSQSNDFISENRTHDVCTTLTQCIIRIKNVIIIKNHYLYNKNDKSIVLSTF